jgi:serine/threonine-protein kinase
MPAITDTLPPRYRDARPIGRGGMGEIFCATDRELGREVALKVLAARYAADQPLRARFEREALAAARLSGTPNIVTIFDVTEHNGRPIIVMEYLSGGSLEAQIGGTPCSPPQALRWLEQAAGALDAAHAAGIVHRDVKPANLLLDGRGELQVADFGVASAAGLDSFTQTGTILGTAGYLSPEQAQGRRATAATDLYSLAVVAWELLTGRRPFAAASPTTEALAHVNAPIPSPSAANPALPRQLDPIFERAMAKDPGDRYPTAAEFVGDLRRALDDAAGDTWIEPRRPAAATETAATQVALTSARRSPRWWIPALALLLLAAGAGAAVLAFRDSGHSASGTPVTVVRTVTSPGRTVQETITTVPATTAPTTTAPSSSDGASLNNTGFAKMRAGDFAGALPLLDQAVQALDGTGSLNEAYAKYNLAYTRLALGQCTDVTALLDQAAAIEGDLKPIKDLRKEAGHTCSPPHGQHGQSQGDDQSGGA